MLGNMKFSELAGLAKLVVKDTLEFSRGSYAPTNFNYFISSIRQGHRVEDQSSLINLDLYESSEHYRRGSNNSASPLAIPFYPIIAAYIEYNHIIRAPNQN